MRRVPAMRREGDTKVSKRKIYQLRMKRRTTSGVCIFQEDACTAKGSKVYIMQFT